MRAEAGCNMLLVLEPLAVVAGLVSLIMIVVLVVTMVRGQRTKRTVRWFAGSIFIFLVSGVITSEIEKQRAVREGWPTETEMSAEAVRNCATAAGYSDPEQWRAAFGDGYTAAADADFCICDPENWQRLQASSFDQPQSWCDASELDKRLAMPAGNLPGPLAAENERAPYLVRDDLEVKGKDMVLTLRLLGIRRDQAEITNLIRVIKKEGDGNFYVYDFDDLPSKMQDSICANTRQLEQITQGDVVIAWRFYDENDAHMRTWNFSQNCA